MRRRVIDFGTKPALRGRTTGHGLHPDPTARPLPKARLSDPDRGRVQGRWLADRALEVTAHFRPAERAVKVPGGLIGANLPECAGRIADPVRCGDFADPPPGGVDRRATLPRGSLRPPSRPKRPMPPPPRPARPTEPENP